MHSDYDEFEDLDFADDSAVQRILREERHEARRLASRRLRKHSAKRYQEKPSTRPSYDDDIDDHDFDNYDYFEDEFDSYSSP